jgi:hypothetical protein
MQGKLVHNPIAFAEFPIKIYCASWQSYKILQKELIQKLLKKIW